ncbi:amino acid ABC transporter permease [Mesosutterella sp. AGMB02718]|uniref:Amino acid ABC transporter permease n=1 Tax=Mesosutterella faecium TaxID=2925194 RepID=A0ABT7IQ15_9BURK|nr:amino acid ABC transporter permease [Mesosutterella sp. AGMB02718]MDL2059391.1 amino acid ABC transporter permease [Mesosutterella sp. AGMB02718]
MTAFRFDVVGEYWPLFQEGAGMTIKLTLACVFCGVILGMLLGLARMASARHAPWKGILHYGVRWPVTVWVSFFRGTPLFVQIFLMYFAVMPVFIHPVDGLLVSGDLARELRSEYGAFIAGFIAISLNAGAYMSEVFRAGIQSLDKGQAEAARSVGMTYWQSMRYIVLPQAFRRMLPALGNNAIAILKDSSLVSAIGLTELAYAARTVAGASARYWEPYLTISAMYWVMTLGLAWLIHVLEARMGRGDQK